MSCVVVGGIMNSLSRLILLSILPLITSCGVGTSSSPERRIDENLVKNSPKMLIGRITANDFTAASMNVQFVAIHKDVKISSGADAERAFKEGTPVSFGGNSSVGLNGSSDVRYDMRLANEGMVNCPPGMNCSNEQFVVAGPRVGIFGGLFAGLITRLKNLFSFLRPSTWIGNNGLGYGYQTQYGNGSDQYGVFVPNPQTPVYQPVPVQTYPGGPINTTPQYPNYPTTQPVNGQYPQNPQYPPLPQGQEPMPTNLR
jgi:hypothetical protein